MSSSTNGHINPLKVKLVFDTDIRQWRYPSSNQWQSLIAFVETSFHIKEYLLQYTDDEMDRITIDSEITLIEAYNLCKQQFRRSFRIFVIEKQCKLVTPTNTNSLFTDDDHIEFHWGSSCNQCKASPIQGVRFKCCICPHFDLCANCESIKDIHDASHPFIKLNLYKNSMYKTVKNKNN